MRFADYGAQAVCVCVCVCVCVFLPAYVALSPAQTNQRNQNVHMESFTKNRVMDEKNELLFAPESHVRITKFHMQIEGS